MAAKDDGQPSDFNASMLQQENLPVLPTLYQTSFSHNYGFVPLAVPCSKIIVYH